MWLIVPDNFRYDVLPLVHKERPRFGQAFADSSDWLPEPPPKVLDEALGGLRDGELEFVILCQDDEHVFQQVAGSGDNGYQLERRSHPDAPLVSAEGPISFDLVHRAMHAYLAGAPDPDDLRWGHEVAPPPKKGLMRRLFGG